MKKVQSELAVPLLDRQGREITFANGYSDQSPRVLQNVPFATLFPDEPVVIIDWLADEKVRPEPEVLAEGVSFDGKHFFPYGWGTGSIKRGVTLGLARDLMRELGFTKWVRDCCRGQRTFFFEGMWGAGNGELEVESVEEGVVYNGHPVEDGFGLMARSLAEKLYSGLKKIRLTGSRDSGQMLQRIPRTEEVRKVCDPLIAQEMARFQAPGKLALDGSELEESKQQWIQELGEDAVYHPYFANALSRRWEEVLYTKATTVRTNAQVRVAIPSTCKKVAVDERVVCWRYPVQTDSGIQDAEAEKGLESEIARIAAMEAVQFTLVSVEENGFMACGILGIVDDDVVGGPDKIVICNRNIKVARGDLKKAVEPQTFHFKEAFLSLGQWWEAGSGIGVNAEWAKELLGLDFDGDLLTLFPVVQPGYADFTPMADVVRAFTVLPTPKMHKENRDINTHERWGFCADSMSPLVGAAANLMATSFMMADRLAFAGRVGWKSVGAMDYTLDRWIKAGTDGPKADRLVWYRKVGGKNIEVKKTMTEIMDEDVGPVQTVMVSKFGSLAPWTKWRRGEHMFRHEIPVAIEKERKLESGTVLYKLCGLSGWEELSETQVENAIWPFMDGTIAEICRLTLPHLRHVVAYQVRANPLNHYLDWAPPVSEYLYALMVDLRDRYAARCKSMNRTDPDEIKSVDTWSRKRVVEICKETGVSERTAGYALWRAVHNRRGTEQGSAVIFNALPEEAKHIWADKPGLNWEEDGQVEAVMIGMGYNVEKPPHDWIGDIEVRHIFVFSKKEKREVGRLVVVPIDTKAFDFKPKGTGSPWLLDQIGTLPRDTRQVSPGCYRASIRQMSKSAWSMRLSPLG